MKFDFPDVNVTVVRHGRTFRLDVANGFYQISGGYYGVELLQVAVTDKERLKAHWEGYIENNKEAPDNTVKEE